MRALGWARSTVGIWKISLRRNHYNTLGISQEASKKEIKKAYLSAAKEHHPDANPNDAEAPERFRKIKEAYETLSNSSKKGDYDGKMNQNRYDGPTSPNYGYNNEKVSTTEEWSQFEKDFGHSGFTFSKNSRRRPDPGGHDPWEQYVRNQQTQSFYQAAMDAEYGHQYQNENFFDDDVFDDFYDEHPNENYQRFHYKNFDQWEEQRQKYESIFNQKYGFKRPQKKTNKKTFEDLEDEYFRQNEKYWETDSHDWKGPYYEEFNGNNYGFYDQVQYEEWERWVNQQPNFRRQEKKTSKPKQRKKPKEKSESLKNAQKVHAQLDEFGQANIKMDGKRFKLNVQTDGSIVMEDLDNPFKKSKKAKKRRK